MLIARRPRGEERVLPEHAAPAERVIKDGWDKDTVRVRAVNEGRWGNSIWVRFARSTGAKTLLTLDLSVGADGARVTSTRGIERGSLVDENWLLALERKHFVALAQTPKTQERIAHMLKTGKPLRN